MRAAFVTLRLAIDARPLCYPGHWGIGRVCQSLIQELGKRPELQVTAITTCPVTLTGVNVRVERCSRFFYYAHRLNKIVRDMEADCLLILAPEAYRISTPAVILIYDLYPIWMHRWIPRRALPSVQYARRRLSAQLQLAALRKAVPVAISAHTAADIMRLRPQRFSSVEVAHPALDPAFSAPGPATLAPSLTDRMPLARRYFLTVGGVNAHKNIQCLLDAGRIARTRLGEAMPLLVIAGNESWPPVSLDLSGLEDVLVRLRGVDDSDLAALYAQSFALVFPSFYEGFGLPALEALACGKPVLAADNSSLPEVVGDAGIYFDPYDPHDLAGQMVRLASDAALYDELASRGVAQSSRFTWSAMADGVLRAVARAVAERQGDIYHTHEA